MIEFSLSVQSLDLAALGDLWEECSSHMDSVWHWEINSSLPV